MRLEDLQDGQTVEYRLGRHGDTRIMWEPWTRGPIYVARNQKGQLVNLTTMLDQWAEYSWRDYHGNGFFDAEEYCLEIKGLV